MPAEYTRDILEHAIMLGAKLACTQIEQTHHITVVWRVTSMSSNHIKD